jgi:hypothetical protein
MISSKKSLGVLITMPNLLMSRKIMKFAPALFLFMFAYCSTTAAEPIKEQIISALLDGIAMNTVREIAKLPQSRLQAEGISVEDNNEGGYDEEIKIIFSTPLTLFGATTNEVILGAPSYENFTAIVYAEFKGNFSRFVRLAKLKKGSHKDSSTVGIYNRALTEEPVCPVTVGATPIDSKRFVFGQGWCNG